MICPHCSAWIPDDSRRCPDCQELLRKSTVVEEQFEDEAKPEKKKKTNSAAQTSKSAQSSADSGTAGRQNTATYADNNLQKHKSYEELDAEINQVLAELKSDKSSEIRSGSGSVSPYVRAIRSSVSSSGKSFVFVIAIVLMTLNCLAQLDSGIELVDFSGTLESVENMLDIDGLSRIGYYLDSAVNEILGGVSNIITTVKIIYHLPAILILLGLWMICIGAFSSSQSLNVIANGCKIIKAVKIIQCICKSLLYFVLIFFMLESVGTYFEDVAGGIVVIIGFILTIELVNCRAICRALNAAADAATGSLAISSSIPGVLTFFCFCDGIFGILISGFTFGALMVPVSVLFFGITLMGFKKKLSAASYVK